MVEPPDRRTGRRALGPFGYSRDHRLGEDAVQFTRWFMRSKYHLMGGFLGELRAPRPPEEAEALAARFCRAIVHGQRVHQGRALVTFLLALGVIATATSAVANALAVDLPSEPLERAAALAASVSVFLVAVRLSLDRYLDRVDVTATFLAIQIAAARE